MNKFRLIFILLLTTFVVRAQNKSKERQELEKKIQENIEVEKRHQEKQKRAKYMQDSASKVKLENENKLALARLEEYERKEKLEREKDSIINSLKQEDQNKKLQKKTSEAEHINSMKSSSNFSFDSLSVIAALNQRIDSLNSAGQTIKAGRIEKQITEIQRRIFGSGREYNFHLIKRKDIIYYSSELESINIFSNAYSGTLIREGAVKLDHVPPTWETSDKLIENYEDLKNDQAFFLKIRLLPSSFSHLNNGRKCEHNFIEDRFKILSIVPF